MSKKEDIKKEIVSYTADDEQIKITIEGKSAMAFWNHDLKFEAAIALLEIIDEKDFAEDDNWEEYHNYVEKVMEALHIESFRR